MKFVNVRPGPDAFSGLCTVVGESRDGMNYKLVRGYQPQADEDDYEFWMHRRRCEEVKESG